MKMRLVLIAVATLFACSVSTGDALAQKDRTGTRLLTAAEGLQMPSSESDSIWYPVSYPGLEELPEARLFETVSGCRLDGVTRQDFGETLDRLSNIEPWMDAGQVSSARGFRKLEGLFYREFEDDVAVYRCDTGGPEIEVYFVGVQEDQLLGLMTVSIET